MSRIGSREPSGSVYDFLTLRSWRMPRGLGLVATAYTRVCYAKFAALAQPTEVRPRRKPQAATRCRYRGLSGGFSKRGVNLVISDRWLVRLELIAEHQHVRRSFDT